LLSIILLKAAVSLWPPGPPGIIIPVVAGGEITVVAVRVSGFGRVEVCPGLQATRASKADNSGINPGHTAFPVKNPPP